MKINLIENPYYPHAPGRVQYFQNLFSQAQTDFSDNQLDSQFDIEILNIDNKGSLPQNWRVRFKGEEGSPYEGKQITGILKFPDNYPEVFPKFYFDKINPNKKYQGTKLGYPYHENIYGDGALCIPLLSDKMWKPNNPTRPFEMIRAISNIFHHPNDGDKANQSFPSEKELIEKARKQLAEALEEPTF